MDSDAPAPYLLKLSAVILSQARQDYLARGNTDQAKVATDLGRYLAHEITSEKKAGAVGTGLGLAGLAWLASKANTGVPHLAKHLTHHHGANEAWNLSGYGGTKLAPHVNEYGVPDIGFIDFKARLQAMPGSGLNFKSQVPHLTQDKRAGVPGQVGDIQRKLQAGLAASLNLAVEEFTNAPAADTDGIKVAAATVAEALSYSGAQLDGVIGAGPMYPARQITITTAGATPAHAPATAVIKGKDAQGKSIMETVVVSQIAGVATSTKYFASVRVIDLPAADGVGATLAFGTGAKAGLSRKVRVRAGLALIHKEIVDGAELAPPTGVLEDSTLAPPYGSYTPAAAFDAAHDQCIVYEQDNRLARF